MSRSGRSGIAYLSVSSSSSLSWEELDDDDDDDDESEDVFDDTERRAWVVSNSSRLRWNSADSESGRFGGDFLLLLSLLLLLLPLNASDPSSEDGFSGRMLFIMLSAISLPRCSEVLVSGDGTDGELS